MKKAKFGVILRQEKIDFKTIRETAELCDELGYHSVWFYDHMLGMGSIDFDVFEAWTLMSALSTITSNVNIGTLVLCNSFRHPPLLAKMAATLDHISNGRLEFAIGAGWFEPEYKAYGYPFPDTITRIEQLKEAVKIIRALWTQEKATFIGEHYQIRDAYCNPKPIQKPHPPITIGGSGEKHLLRAVAELADGWNCPASNASEYERKLNVLKNHCKSLGRDINEMEISEQTVCVIAKDKAELEEKLPKAKKRYSFFGDIEKTGIVGTPDQCIEKIRHKVNKGVSKFTIFFYDILNPEYLRLFAKEVMSVF